MAPGLLDVVQTFSKPKIIFFMAWSDIRARYKRSVLGPLWITLSTAIGIVGLGMIWSELLHLEKRTYVPMLTIGLVLWQFLSGTINEASAVFTRQTSLIRNLPLPFSLYIAQLVLRQLINLAHNIPLYFLVIFILDAPMSWEALLAIPALIIVSINLFWIVMIIGILGTRFRDLEYLISTIMPLLMFFSPVMYRPSSLPFNQEILLINPFSYMIEIVRSPLLGEIPSMTIIEGNLGMLFFGAIIALNLLNRKIDRIALWV